jgi:hypothetical protein
MTHSLYQIIYLVTCTSPYNAIIDTVTRQGTVEHEKINVLFLDWTLDLFPT